MLRICCHISLLLLVLVQSAFADGGEAAPRFKDVRIGEDVGISRVIVICAAQCVAEQDRDGSFYLDGVSGSLDINLGERAGFISALRVEDLSAGAFLRVDTNEAPSDVVLADCGDAVICIDFAHPKKVGQFRSAEETPPEKKTMPIPLPEKSQTAPKPTVSDGQATRNVSIRTDLTNPDTWSAEIAADLRKISPLVLSRIKCPSYQTRLQINAWDLEAYRMIALCSAAYGDLAKAEMLLERLLKLYPDDQIASSALVRLSLIGAAKDQTKMALRSGL